MLLKTLAIIPLRFKSDLLSFSRQQGHRYTHTNLNDRFELKITLIDNNFLISWLLVFFIFFSFIFISWRLITLQYYSVFFIHWHESAMDLHVFPIPIPLPISLSTRSLWIFPVHQVRALVSCIQPGLLICFTLDNIHVPMLFSQNTPPSPSPTESKNLFCTSVSLFLFCM